MEIVLEAKDLKKTFYLSKKQQKIEKTNLTKKVAVNHLSFSLYKGEIFGLLGPNGAGKTTTLRIISTLIKSDEGDVLVEGFSVKNQPNEVRNRIGFLTSELKLEDFLRLIICLIFLVLYITFLKISHNKEKKNYLKNLELINLLK